MPAFEFYRVTRTSMGTQTRVVLASVDGAYQEGDAAEDIETVNNVEVVHPLGWIARPVIPANVRGTENKVKALCVEHGVEVLALGFVDKGGAESGAPAMGDLVEGEARAFSPANAACRTRYKADGAMDIEVPAGKAVTIRQAGGGTITIDANGDVRIDSAASAKVYVQNGTKNVAREESIVNGGTLTAVAGPYPVTFTHVPASPGPMPPAPPGGVVLQGRILTGEGNPRIKV